MKELNALNEAYIRDELSRWKATAHQMKCYVKLVPSTEFESERQEIEALPNIQAFTGEYEMLEILNSYLVSIGIIGSFNYIEEGIPMVPYVLYVYSD